MIGNTIHPTSSVASGSHVVHSTMGRHSYCGYDCNILYCDIGSFCSIANRVTIGGARHPIEWVSTSPVFFEMGKRDGTKHKLARNSIQGTHRTTIKNDVWIGESVLIQQGVTIGNGAVIGMGSVVTKDVDDYSIVAGTPARLIRKRFSEKMIQELSDHQWWNLDDDALRELGHLIPCPLEFLHSLREYNVL